MQGFPSSSGTRKEIGEKIGYEFNSHKEIIYEGRSSNAAFWLGGLLCALYIPAVFCLIPSVFNMKSKSISKNRKLELNRD